MTRQSVDEVDLLQSWKDGTSLLDPLDAHPDVVTLSDLKAGIQPDRRRQTQPQQFGTSRNRHGQPQLGTSRSA
jgi:hypothetical protein